MEKITIDSISFFNVAFEGDVPQSGESHAPARPSFKSRVRRVPFLEPEELERIHSGRSIASHLSHGSHKVENIPPGKPQLARIEDDLRSRPVNLSHFDGGLFTVAREETRMADWAKQQGQKVLPRKFTSLPEPEVYEVPEEYKNSLLQMLRKADKQEFANGWSVERGLGHGYHSFDLPGFTTKGQRVPRNRLQKISKFLDLKGKSILDLGCATGGMLFHQTEAARLIGWDFDPIAIRFARTLASAISLRAPEYARRFSFHRVDLDSLEPRDFEKFLKDGIVDTIFMLSIGSWVRRWPEYYSIAAQSGATIVLETNNDKEGEPQLALFQQLGMHILEIPEASLDDQTGNLRRKTFIVQKSKL